MANYLRARIERARAILPQHAGRLVDRRKGLALSAQASSITSPQRCGLVFVLAAEWKRSHGSTWMLALALIAGGSCRLACDQRRGYVGSPDLVTHSRTPLRSLLWKMGLCCPTPGLLRLDRVPDFGKMKALLGEGHSHAGNGNCSRRSSGRDCRDAVASVMVDDHSHPYD